MKGTSRRTRRWAFLKRRMEELNAEVLDTEKSSEQERGINKCSEWTGVANRLITTSGAIEGVNNVIRDMITNEKLL